MRAGERIGPYRVTHVLGKGGMGTVAAAHDDATNRTVAVKVLRRALVSPELRARFERERQILARLDHPRIARILDAGTSRGMPWFAMELVDGEPLDVYSDRHRLSIASRLRLVVSICDALAEAHRNRVVHRDLKPSNILVDAEGEPKLLDFGIAKDLDPLRDAAITRTGQLALTLSHASPEQVRGLSVGIASDVYSLGVVLYQLLCGHPPHALGDDGFENLRAICERVPPSPSARVATRRNVRRGGETGSDSRIVIARARAMEPDGLERCLKGGLDAIVAKALAKRPGDRYSTIEALGVDLQRYLDGQPIAVQASMNGAASGTPTRWRRHVLAVALVVLFFALVGMTYWRGSRRSAEHSARSHSSLVVVQPEADPRTIAVSNGQASRDQPVRARDREQPGPVYKNSNDPVCTDEADPSLTEGGMRIVAPYPDEADWPTEDWGP